MPFNGAGAYSLPAGSIVADGTTIDAADHNTPLQDIESSLSTVTLRNGATPFTGNQSFGNNKITSLAAGTVATDGATLAQAQSQASNRATAIGGTANAVTLTFSPPFAAYTNGMRIRWRATATNTGAMTVNVDGLGVKNFQIDASGTLAATFSGAVQNGTFIEAEYNLAADVFVWLNQKPVFIDASGNGNVELLSSNASGSVPIFTARNSSGATPGTFGPTYRLINGVSGKHGYAISMYQSSGSEFVIANSDSPFTPYIGIDQNGNIGFGTVSLTTAAGNIVFQKIGYVEHYRDTINAADGAYDMYSNWGATKRGVLRFQANGNLLNFNNSYGALSDAFLKENIVDATDKLESVRALRVRNFNMKGDGTKQIGFVAQEIEKVFPGLVEENGEGIKSVKYSVLVPILVKALQELAAEVADLKARVNAA